MWPARGPVTQSKAESPLTQKLLDRIVQSPQDLIALETTDVAETLAHRRMLALRGGTAVDGWEPESGVASLRESGLQVPGTKRFADALRYIAQSPHFGIYLFPQFPEQLKPADTMLLRRISRMQGVHQRKLVFLGDRFELPEELDGLFERLPAQDRKRADLRLRDGRWVQ